MGSMVGTGVFTTTGLLIRDLGSPLAVLAACFLGGVLALCGAVSYAELVAALPRNGGEYQLLGRIYHPALGFAAGLISLVVGFSAPLAASVSAMLMAGPRVYEAVGLDHPRLRPLAYRTRSGGPLLAIALQAVTAVAMIATSSFGTLLAYIGFTLSLVAALTVLGVIVLRQREPALPRPYRTWGYPVTPLLFVILSLWMALHGLVENPAASWAGVAMVATSLALYAALGRPGKALPGAASS